MIFILRIIRGAVIIFTLVGTLVSQFIIRSLTGGQLFILANSDLSCDRIVVRTVVGNVQLTITVNECQVTVTVKTTCMSSTQCNKVAMIYIVDGCRGITEYRRGVGIHG